MAFQDVERAAAQLEAGGFVLLLDDASTPPVSFLIKDAAQVTEADVCFMAAEGRGVICAAVTESRLRQLDIPIMPSRYGIYAPDFSISVEARRGVSTGISAHDRVVTLRTIATTTQPKIDLVMPGHIFPIRARRGGVLVRTTAAEATIDLLHHGLRNRGHLNSINGPDPSLSLQHSNPQIERTGAIIHCLDSSGSFLSVTGAQDLSARYCLPLVTISSVVGLRLAKESILEKIAEAQLPTQAGQFTAVSYRSLNDGAEHLALYKGDIRGGDAPVLARVQAEEHITDLLGGSGASTRDRINSALRLIESEGRGVFVYVRHPRSGELRAKIDRLSGTQPAGSTATSQIREIGIGSQILASLGVKQARLLTSSNWPLSGVEAFQVQIAGTVPF